MSASSGDVLSSIASRADALGGHSIKIALTGGRGFPTQTIVLPLHRRGASACRKTERRNGQVGAPVCGVYK